MCSRIIEKMVVEIDGSYWEGGRDKEGEGIWAEVGLDLWAGV